MIPVMIMGSIPCSQNIKSPRDDGTMRLRIRE